VASTSSNDSSAAHWIAPDEVPDILKRDSGQLFNQRLSKLSLGFWLMFASGKSSLESIPGLLHQSKVEEQDWPIHGLSALLVKVLNNVSGAVWPRVINPK
jgi:hypothetical protein